MTQRWVTLFVAMGLTCPAAMAQDNKTAKWGQVEGWAIRVDRSVGDGCFATQLYEDGSAIRIGFDIKKGSMYFMLGNENWKSLEAGKLYRLRFVFDNARSFDGDLTGHKLGERVYLDHSNISSDFAKAFMERSTMQVLFRDTQVAKLSLRNTYAAVMEVAKCQLELTPSGSSDPFSNSGNRRDPFR